MSGVLNASVTKRELKLRRDQNVATSEKKVSSVQFRIAKDMSIAPTAPIKICVVRPESVQNLITFAVLSAVLAAVVEYQCQRVRSISLVGPSIADPENI
jgi:hypothetical protein